MKRIFAIFIAVFLCFGLCSCNFDFIMPGEVLEIKDMSIELPTYWEEEDSKKECLSYFAEKGKSGLIEYKTASLDIEFHEESDPEADVTFEALWDDNENMIRYFEKKYNDANVLGTEIFESEYGVKGILYKFSYNKIIGLFSDKAARGYCFCFPSESDRVWYYITLIKTNDAEAHSYENDYMKTLATIKCQPADADDSIFESR